MCHQQELLLPRWTDRRTWFSPSWSPSRLCSGAVTHTLTACGQTLIFLSSAKAPASLTPPRGDAGGMCARGVDNAHTLARGRHEESPHNQRPGTEKPFAALALGCQQSVGA